MHLASVVKGLLAIGSILVVVEVCCKHNEKNMYPMDSDTYDVIVKILRGTFNVPVRDRSKIQKAAIVRLWRNKRHFRLTEDGTGLLFRNKIVLTPSTSNPVIAKEYYAAKGAGARKLRHRLKDKFAGISERHLLRTLSQSRIHQRLQAKFANKAPLKPVRSKHVHDRHQLDLVDMSRWKVVYDKSTYRYILCIMDVFSRYCWLRPMTSKHSDVVAKELRKIYSQHGWPRSVQTDQGTEFKGKVHTLLKSHGVVVVRGRPYHPQSQGKIERGNRSLKKKLRFDELTKGRYGMNWVRQLTAYEKQLNSDPKEILAWQTPFEVYFGRKDVTNYNQQGGTIGSYLKNVKQRRKKARKATEKCDERMTKRPQTTTVYKKDEKVLIRVTGKHPKKRYVLPGIIKKRNLNLHRYKVAYKIPDTDTVCLKWFSVEDLTSNTRDSERKAPKLDRILHCKQHKQKYYIPMLVDDRLDIFSRLNFRVRYNPTGDGSCQFSAIANLVRDYGIHRSADTLRQEIVNFMERNPYASDGTPLHNFVAVEWDTYLENMRRNSYGDHLTLQAASTLFGVQIITISTLGIEAATVITPSGSGHYCHSLPTITLGHYAENAGEHYVALAGNTDIVLETIDQSRNSEYTYFYGYRQRTSPPRDDYNKLYSPFSDSYDFNEPCSFESMPAEMKSCIIRHSVLADYSMIGTWNRVSKGCRNLVRQFYPIVHIAPHVYKRLRSNSVSIRQLSLLTGRSSGLMTELRRLFSSNSRWVTAWLVLVATMYIDWYKITDIFWR